VSTRSLDAFVSEVTSECGKARDAVVAKLRKLDLHVAVRSDFEHHPAGTTTLRKLHNYVRDCAEMHRIIGTRSGACPPPDAAAPFAHLLPPGITEASYPQWEYFFAVRYVPDRLWLYIATDACQPDLPAPAGADQPELQLHFVEHLRGELGQDYAPFANVGEVRAEVLAHEAERRRALTASGDPVFSEGASSSETFYCSVAANVIGGVIAGVIVTALLWVATKSGGDVNPALAVLALLASGAGGVAFAVTYQRYTAVVTRRGPHTRAACNRLRRHLKAGWLAAETYTQRLTAALDATDGFFGDASMADRTLFPHAFSLRTLAPLWTAPTFDRYLLLALLYPIATIILMWAASGHVGPAEKAFLLLPDLPGGRHVTAVGAWMLALFAFWRWFLVTIRVARRGTVLDSL
jgi:hypothetical protein